MADEKFNKAIQQNLITLLAFDDTNGKIVAGLVDTNLFEGELRVIAEKCVDFWKRHGEAPKDHTADLIANILEDKTNRKAGTYHRILMDMTQLSESVNTEYVLDQLHTFTRLQRMKDAILKSAERINSQQELAIEAVEEIWTEMLRTREVSFDPGMRLQEYDRVIAYLARQQSEFSTGIAVLDKRNIIPYRGSVMMILGPTGRGKSWCLINIGKRALLQRKKVLHISLEMSEEEVGQRYYQALFSVTQRTADIEIAKMERDKHGILTGFSREIITPDFAFDSDVIHEELESRVTYLDAKVNNLIIKRFPMRSLTIAGLRAYLDNLEGTEQFIPDMLILDYLGIMRTDSKDEHRIALGRVGEDFRGLCTERYVAGVTAQQVNRIGASADLVKMTHVSEDWSLMGTADQTMTITSTDLEKKLGYARLYVGKARTAETDAFSVLITQNLRIGQFCLDSVLLDKSSRKLLDEELKNEDGDDDDLEEDEAADD